MRSDVRPKPGMICNRRKLCFSVLVLAATMYGCRSTPPSTFYTLSPASQTAIGSVGATGITVGPLDVPDYLDRPQIVIRNSSTQIKLAEFHRWAEPLDEGIQRILASNVSRLLDSESVVAYPSRGKFGRDLHVVGRIQRFDTDAQGNALLEVQWGVLDSQGDQAAAPKRRRYTAKASNPTDYDAVVAALDDTLAQFSVDIAKNLVEAVDRRP